MSLQIAAQHLASRGRGPDTQLIHMAPQEVAGLQALAKAHGGSLTTNPDTGLPEAGFLSSILPTVIGAGLSIASGGALTPLMAAGITGAGYGLASGSLTKGLMAGLGAYGGAGLAGGLTAAGAAGAAAGIAPGTAGTTAAMQGGFGTGSALAGTEAAGSALAQQGTTAAMQGGFGVPEVLGASGPSTAQLAAGAPQVATATPMGDHFAQAGQGLQNLMTEGGRDAFMSKEGVGGMSGLFKYGYAGLSPALMEMLTPEQQAEKAKESAWRYNYNPGRAADPQAGYSGAATGERTYFNPVYTRTAADGGLMDAAPIEQMSNRNEAETLMANGGMRFAEGGISHLGDYSDGGRLLRGPGDGVSDDIPATIGGKRPARLADGEFVVPARIVSELGNGSTEAGARKLYAMLDRVQKARGKTVGKDRVAANTKAEKLLPA